MSEDLPQGTLRGGRCLLPAMYRPEVRLWTSLQCSMPCGIGLSHGVDLLQSQGGIEMLLRQPLRNGDVYEWSRGCAIPKNVFDHRREDAVWRRCRHLRDNARKKKNLGMQRDVRRHRTKQANGRSSADQRCGTETRCWRPPVL